MFPISPLKALIIYIIIINVYAFMIVGWDKSKAQRNKWRTPEKHFWIVGFIGGAAGVLAGMRTFRHKTQHAAFKYGIPLLLLLNILLLYIALNYI